MAIQFVGTNAAAQNFFSAGFGVEQPLPTLLNERDGKGASRRRQPKAWQASDSLGLP